MGDFAGDPKYRLMPSRRNPKVRRWMRAIGDKEAAVPVGDILGHQYPLFKYALRIENTKLGKFMDHAKRTANFARLVASARIEPDSRVRYPTFVKGSRGYRLKVPRDYLEIIKNGSPGDPMYDPKDLHGMSPDEVFERDVSRAIGRLAVDEMFFAEGLSDHVPYLSEVSKIAKELKEKGSRIPSRLLVDVVDRESAKEFVGALFEHVVHDPKAVELLVYKIWQRGTHGQDVDHQSLIGAMENLVSLPFGYPAIFTHVLKHATPEEVLNPKNTSGMKVDPNPSSWQGGNDHWIDLMLGRGKRVLMPVVTSQEMAPAIFMALTLNENPVSVDKTPFVKEPHIRRFMEAMKKSHPRLFEKAASAQVVLGEVGSRVNDVLPNVFAPPKLSPDFASMPISHNAHHPAWDVNTIIMMEGDARRLIERGEMPYDERDVPYALFLHEFVHAIDFSASTDNSFGLPESAAIMMGVGSMDVLDGVARAVREVEAKDRVRYASSDPAEVATVIAELAFAKPDDARKLMENKYVRDYILGFFGFDPVEVMHGE